jgi:hypothetical protein
MRSAGAEAFHRSSQLNDSRHWPRVSLCPLFDFICPAPHPCTPWKGARAHGGWHEAATFQLKLHPPGLRESVVPLRPAVTKGLEGVGNTIRDGFSLRLPTVNIIPFF